MSLTRTIRLSSLTRAFLAVCLIGVVLVVTAPRAGALLYCDCTGGGLPTQLGVNINMPVADSGTTCADSPGGSTLSQACAVESATLDGTETFPIVRVDSAFGGSLSTYFQEGLQVDVLIAGSSPSTGPCDGPEDPYGFYDSSGTVPATCQGGDGSGAGVAAINPTVWAASALSYYETQCGTSSSAASLCPEVEVLNEPGGYWYWSLGDSSGETGDTQENAVSQLNADAYATLVEDTYNVFEAVYGSDMPYILASFDGGNTNDTWGTEVWANHSGASHIDLTSYVMGVTVHPYGGTSGTPGRQDNVTDAWEDSGENVYVTEIGWSSGCTVDWTNCADSAYDTSCTRSATPAASYAGCQNTDSNAASDKQWSEYQQANNYCNFVTWAQGTGYVAQVFANQYADLGNTANNTGWWGVVRYGEGGSTTDFSHKPAWTSLEEAAASVSCKIT
jgi:hypothetical protein